MRVQIYHCSYIVIHDKKNSKDRGKRPEGVLSYPSKPGLADIDLLPPIDGLKDQVAVRLLEALQVVAPFNSTDTFLEINWDSLSRKLKIDHDTLRQTLIDLCQSGIVLGFTTVYDHEKLIEKSKNKGYLAVMMYIEDNDFVREDIEEAFAHEITQLANGIVNRKEGEQLREVVIVPDSHVLLRDYERTSPKWDEEKSRKAIQLCDRLVSKLRKAGFKARVASFGYSKMIHFVIHAHKLGYVLRHI